MKFVFIFRILILFYKKSPFECILLFSLSQMLSMWAVMVLIIIIKIFFKYFINLFFPCDKYN